ncbi:MAG: SIR2 family protein [Deltaproteobacteria bacterium]|nr:SIR2 family protein [Deltaproteobacteria bacterium]
MSTSIPMSIVTDEPFEALSLDQLTESRVQMWRERGFVFLVGSYISTFNPTNMPSGETVGKALSVLLFPEGEEWPDWLKTDFETIPFEALMECYPDSRSLPGILIRLYGDAVPNDVHKLLVTQLDDGCIHGIVTTNYDEALEKSLTPSSRVEIVHRKPHSWVCDEASSRRFLFKIHGTARPELSHTLAYRLRDERRLTPEQQSLLRKIVAGRTLVCLGYSGRDFDICPELASDTAPTYVVWVAPKKLEPNARRVLEAHCGTRLCSDKIAQVLGRLLGVIPAVKDGGQKEWNLRAVFDARYLDEWRIRVLDRMACASLLVRCVPSVRSPSDNIDLYRRRASLFGHMGKYEDAARTLDEIAAQCGLSPTERARRLLVAASSWFIHGSYRRALSRWRRALRIRRGLHEVPDELRAELAEVEVMMLMRLSRLPVWFGGSVVRRLAKHRYEHALDYLEQNGLWDRLQALQHNAERLRIARSNRLPLSPIDGYSSLGLVAMNAIRARDELRTTRGRLSSEQQEKAKNFLKKAKNYGWHHEAWKLCWILLWRGRGADRRAHYSMWREHFRKTQYSFAARISVLLRQCRW